MTLQKLGDLEFLMTQGTWRGGVHRLPVTSCDMAGLDVN